MLLLLTRAKRSIDCSELKNAQLLLPVMISRTKTPKLYTSDLVEYCPRMTYSGAIYPLQEDLMYSIMADAVNNGI